jgi:hypothetical protein
VISSGSRQRKVAQGVVTKATIIYSTVTIDSPAVINGALVNRQAAAAALGQPTERVRQIATANSNELFVERRYKRWG